jgi:hypothetical protein
LYHQISLTGNADTFAGLVVEIAGMDVFKGEAITSYFLTFSNNKPLSDHWESRGFENMNFALNLASLIMPILILIMVWSTMVYIINLIAVKYY